jgi:hypothetical protein
MTATFGWPFLLSRGLSAYRATTGSSMKLAFSGV